MDSPWYVSVCGSRSPRTAYASWQTHCPCPQSPSHRPLASEYRTPTICIYATLLLGDEDPLFLQTKDRRLIQRQRLAFHHPCQSLSNEGQESFRFLGRHGLSNSFQRRREDRFECLIRNLPFG